MKFRLILMLSLLARFSFAQYQTDEGQKILGGQIAINTSTIENDSQKTVNNVYTISPYVGYFPNNNLAIGLQLIYTSSLNDSRNLNNGTEVDLSKTKQNMMGLSPFIRYYVPVGPKMKFYGQVNAYNGFGTAVTDYSSQTSGYTSDLDVSQFGVSVTPGFTFFVTSKLGIDASFNLMNYNKYRFKSGDLEIQNNDSFSFKVGDLVPNFGATFFF